MLRNIRITGDPVVGQVGDISAIKTFVVSDPRETRGRIDSKRDPGEADDNKRDEEKAARSGSGLDGSVTQGCLRSQSAPGSENAVGDAVVELCTSARSIRLLMSA